jgi:DNA-binding GntR family transcriptional regulator
LEPSEGVKGAFGGACMIGPYNRSSLCLAVSSILAAPFADWTTERLVPMVTAKRPKGSGARWAYETIRSRILSLELAPGKDLDEQELISSLGLSRTPIREALIQLAAEGLVELLPNRGAKIAKIDLPGVREFFEALDANQRMVTRWAALRHTKDDLRRIDEERRNFDAAVASGNVSEMMSTNLAFHEAIAVASGNSLVARSYCQLLAFGLRLSHISLAYEATSIDRPDTHKEDIAKDHLDMLRHLMTGDADAAEESARQHTERFRARVLVFLQANLAADMKF